MSWQDNASFENQVVRAFLAMPEGAVKQALGQLVLRLASELADCRCPEAQADGVPCQEPTLDCATCRGWLERLQSWATA